MTRIRTLSTAGPLNVYDCKTYSRTISGYCTSNPTYLDRETNVYVGTGAASSTLTKTMEDVVTPKYEQISATGGIVNSPMTQNSVFIDEPACTINLGSDVLYYCAGLGKRLQAQWRTAGQAPFSIASKPSTAKYLSITPFTDAEISDCQDRASSKAYSNIDHTDILLLATAAEANKTVAGLSQLLFGVTKILRKLKRGQFKLIRRELEAGVKLADLYMQARYELRPLYYDAIGLLNAMNRVSPPIGSRETFRGYEYIEKSVNQDFQYNQFYGSIQNMTMPCKTRSVTTHKVDCRAGVLTQFLGLKRYQEYGIYAIPETVWELIPFSFIIDWFMNVGTVVAAWTPNVESKPLASWIVTTSVITKSAEIIPQGPVFSSVSATSPECVNAFCDIKAKHQQITTKKWRIPAAKQFSFPQFTVNLDPLKILDLGIIIRNLFKAGSNIKNIR